MARAAGQPHQPVVLAERGDRRFNDDEWRDNPWYSLLKQTYLLNARLLEDMVEASDFDAKAKHKASFFARQFIDSARPIPRPRTQRHSSSPSKPRAKVSEQAWRICSRT